jgi:hypothetical protein
VFYTYAHYKPEGGLFYIGKGKRRRAYQMDGRNPYWQNIVNKYGKPHVELLAKWDKEQEALDHEVLLISCFKDMGFALANITNGGEGVSGFSKPAWNKGIPLSEEQKSKMSASLKGRLHSEETKDKIRSALTGLKRKPMSVEQKAKLSASHKGQFVSESTRQALSLAHKGRKHRVIKCPHCDKIGGLTVMPRWHFDNCKFKGI